MIHHNLSLIALCAVLSSTCLAQPSPDPQWTSLWNGRNLDGWTSWLNTPHRSSTVPGLRRDEQGRYTEAIGSNRDPLGVFSIVDVDSRPAIRITGEAFGELRSHASLQNYHLTLEFKWGKLKWAPREMAETPRDSGLLYHVHSDSGVEGRNWSRSIELQIQEGDCGDLYAIGSTIATRAQFDKTLPRPQYVYDADGIWTWFSQIPGQSGRCIKSHDAEHPSGEWNTIELICLGNEAIHIVNGHVVMRLSTPMRIDSAKPTPVNSGPIILQSEGAEIFYRNIQYRNIESVPDAYAL